MPKRKFEESDFDLECPICENNPTFSDISHLLTHISAKAHLSVRRDLEVEAVVEPAAKQEYDDYGRWERENGLLDMLAERRGLKNIKKLKKKKASAPIKRERKVPSQQENLDAESSNSFRAPAAMMHPLPIQSNNASTTGSEWEPSIYDTPIARRQVPNFSRQQTISHNTVDPSLTVEPIDDDQDDEIEDEVEVVDGSKVMKGKIWPGMDVFDSATPEGKRMRNQKKSGKVLEDMMADALAVDPAEISYHSTGAFRGVRDILGDTISIASSPIRKKPTPRKRKTRSKANPLSDRSTNAPRLRQNRRGGNSSGRMGDNASGQTQAEYQQPLNPLTADGGFRLPWGTVLHPSDFENHDFRMTFGTTRPLTVLRDAPEISPVRTESPLEEPHFDFSNHGLINYQNNLSNSAPIPSSPTLVARPNSFQNTNSMYGAAGGHERSGQGESSTQSHARRTLSASHVYPPQAFHYDSNPLFSHNYTRSYAYGGGQSYMVNNTHTTSYMENATARSPGIGSSFSTEFHSVNSMASSSRLAQQAQGRQAD